MSVLRTGRGRAGGAGGGGRGVGEVEFLTEKKKVPGVLKRQKSFFSLLNLKKKKSSWGSETHANKNLFFGGGGGGFWGVWGTPRSHPGVARSRKTIHFFLWP